MVFHDVTARRRAEVALAATQQRFRAVFDQAAAGIVVTDLEGRILEANPQFLQIAGRTLEELRAITITDVTHPVDVEPARVRMRQLLSGQIPQSAHEERYIRKDGSVVWSRTTATLLRNLVGEGDRLISIVENVTERRDAEAALRDTRARLDAMLAAAEIGTWTWDVVNDRVVVDKNLARMSGVITETMGGVPLKSFLAAIHPDDRAGVEAALRAAIGSGEHGYEVEYRLLRPDASARWIVVRGSAQFDASGVPYSWPAWLSTLPSASRRKSCAAVSPLVVESSDDAILSKNLDGIIVTWNKGAERMFGYSPDEVIGRPVTMLIPPEQSDDKPPFSPACGVANASITTKRFA